MFLVLFLVLLLPFYYYPVGPSTGTGTLVRYVGAACLPYACFRTLRRGWMPSLLRISPVRWYLAYVALVLVSYLRVGDVGNSAKNNPVLTHTSMLVLLLIVFMTVDSLKSLYWVVLTEIGAVSLGGLYLIREWQVARGWQTGYRGGYMVGDGNIYSIGASVVVPLALCLGRKGRPTWQRIYSISCCLVTAGAVMIDGSRGGLLGITAALVFVFWHSRNRLRNFVLAFVILLAFNVLYSRSPMNRILHPNAGDQIGTDARLMQWHAGLRIIRDHPLMGVGFGQFKASMGQYVPASYSGRNMAHNAFLLAAAEMGLPTLFSLLATFISIYRGLARMTKLKSRPLLIRDTVTGLKAGVLGMLVAICFVPALQEKELYFALFLSMCLPYVARMSSLQAMSNASCRTALSSNSPLAK